MAVLACYAAQEKNMPLPDFLDAQVFRADESTTLAPEPHGVEGYDKFIARYRMALPVEQAAGILEDE